MLVAGYRCSCDGDELVGDGHELCELHPCISGAHRCHQHAHCLMTSPNYTCLCLAGYSGDGYSCEPRALLLL